MTRDTMPNAASRSSALRTPSGPSALSAPGMSRRRTPRRTARRGGAVRALAFASVIALAGTGLTACSDARDPAVSSESCDAFAHYAPEDGAGGSVTIATTFTGTEGERFEQSLARFEECTGIDVVHQGDDRLEANLRGRAAGETGWDADLAVVPQPGLVADLVDKGALDPMPEAVGANVELGWDHVWSAAGTVNGTFYAAPLMASVKSFVWYSPQAFEKAGYKVPGSWDELVTLTNRIVADHPGGEVTPWCLGVADGATTGWPMTDWLEEGIVATGGTNAYDSWADHDVPVDSPTAVEALDAVGSVLLADGHVPGGRQGAGSRTMGQAGQQLVDGTCLMMLASSNFESMLPASGPGTTAGAPTDGIPVDGEPTAIDAPGEPTADGAGAAAPASGGTAGVSAFVFPGAEDEDGGSPVLVAGDYLVSLHRDGGSSRAATGLMDYLTSAEWARRRAELGGMATANRGVEANEVGSDAAAHATRILQSRQSVIRLDASDSMPSRVGTDALWTALTSWTAGEVDSKRALAQAEKAWPRK